MITLPVDEKHMAVRAIQAILEWIHADAVQSHAILKVVVFVFLCFNNNRF